MNNQQSKKISQSRRVEETCKWFNSPNQMQLTKAKRWLNIQNDEEKEQEKLENEELEKSFINWIVDDTLKKHDTKNKDIINSQIQEIIKKTNKTVEEIIETQEKYTGKLDTEALNTRMKERLIEREKEDLEISNTHEKIETK